jgi:gluconolactonase
MTRRQFLISSTASTLAVSPLLAAPWEPSQRYPDPLVCAIDPSFSKYMLGLAKIEKIASGMRWAEGPVWFGDGRFLLWSDIPNNRIMRWDEETGRVSIFRKPSNNSNGNTRDRQGRLLTCEHDTRRVTRTEYDGSITVIADRFNGKPLNSPNDIVCKSDGSIWFTDPPYGVLGFYEGHVANPELPTQVYRWDPSSGKLTVATDEVTNPNGLAFSPDESKLYIVQSGGAERALFVADVAGGGQSLSGLRRLVKIDQPGAPDGLRVDLDGNLWAGWGMGAHGLDGVSIFNPEGKLIGRIDLPERCANLCFGGRQRNRLFMCASTSIFSLFVNTQGVAGG